MLAALRRALDDDPHTFVAARGGHRGEPRRAVSRAWRSSATRFFRVTRDADFEVSDEADDLLQAVEAELRRRRFGEAVRLEVDADIDAGVRELLHRGARTSRQRQVYEVDGLLDLERPVADLRRCAASASCATRRGRRSRSRACRARSPSA